MQLQRNEYPQGSWGRKTIKGTLIAALVLLGGIIWNYSEVPKSIAYTAFRSLYKYGIGFQTRDWERLTGEHFEVRYLPGDAGIAKMVLETAERFVEPVNSRLDYVPKGRMLVLLYPDRESLGESFGWSANQSAMGVYWAGVIRVLSPSAWIENAAAVELAEEFRSTGPMVHEYTHLAVDYIARGNYPRWLTEGVAQYVERDVTGFILWEPLVHHNEEWIPLEKLDSCFDNALSQSKAYRQSLAMLDCLVEKHGPDSFLRILRRLGQGANLNVAWKAETGKSLEEFQRDFLHWSSQQIE